MRPHAVVLQVTASPRLTVNGIVDMERYLQQWQTQAHAEKQRQRRKSMGRTKSRAAKFPAYLDSSTIVPQAPSKPLGSFASLGTGLCLC